MQRGDASAGDGDVPVLTSGTYYLAHWFEAIAPTASRAGDMAGVTAWPQPHNQSWVADAVPPPGSHLELDARAGAMAGGLPVALAGPGAAPWINRSGYGLPLGAEWDAVGGWCDQGATLPPPISRKPDDAGDGRITEPGALLATGQVLENIAIRGNTFIAPKPVPSADAQAPGAQAFPWRNSFVHLGVTRGVDVRDNAMFNAGADVAGRAPDMVFYSNTALASRGNRCYGSGSNSSDKKRHCSVKMYT